MDKCNNNIIIVIDTVVVCGGNLSCRHNRNGFPDNSQTQKCDNNIILLYADIVYV